MSDELSRFFGTLNQRLEEAMQTEQWALERFFVALGPRLETARTLESELDRQLARRFNVFDYLRTDELGLSRMIGDLLNPAGSHGQGAAFLQCLVDRLLKEEERLPKEERMEFAKDCDLNGSKVDCERTIPGGRIDIVVEIDDMHCLAIENKAKGAGDQHDQVQKYLSWLKDNYKEYLLVYLTPTGKGPSEGSFARVNSEAPENETTRRLIIMPCGPSRELNDEFSDPRLSFSLADWLADCRRSCDVDRLRWFLREAEIFFHSMGGTTVTTAESNAVKDFVLAHPENVATALAVYESWPAITEQIKSDFLKMICEKMPNDTVHYWKYGEKALHSYIYIHRKNWRPYRDLNGKEVFTRVYMQADSRGGNNWSIGVKSIPIDKVDNQDQERRLELKEAFAEYGESEPDKYSQPETEWLSWEWAKHEYRWWDALLPRLHEECKTGSDVITEYFVGQLKTVFEQVAHIIDRIDCP